MARTLDTSEGDYPIDINTSLYAPDVDGTVGAMLRERVTSGFVSYDLFWYEETSA